MQKSIKTNVEDRNDIMSERKRTYLVFLCGLCISGFCGCGVGIGSHEETVSKKEVITEDVTTESLKSEEGPGSSTTSEMTEPNEESTDTGTKQAESQNADEPDLLHFIDAWGEWHDAVINPNVKKHDYDWNCLKNDGQNISYEGDDRYTIRKGVDVSYHQGKIDWQKVKADGYDFAIIRAAYRGYGTTGSLNIDSEFYTYVEQAHEAELDVGVYLFSQAVNVEEALEEADLMIQALSDITIELPVVYDPELIRDSTARTDHVTGQQFTENTLAFCRKIQEAGYQPMIYSNMIWESEFFDLEQLAEYPVWYADYELIPQTHYDFCFWQYSESGQVDGITGIVDLNIQFQKSGKK